jgi:uncharacterized membrane protein YhaH (DUF805 family)
VTAQQQQWFFSTGGERYGPVGFDYLLDLAKSGRLDPRNDLVWTTTLGDWEAAGDVEGLFERRAVKREEAAEGISHGFASTGTHESTPIPKAHFPGTGRVGHLLGTVVLPVAITIGWQFATPLILRHAPENVHPYVPLAVFPLAGLMVMMTLVKRFQNLGMSGFWVLGLLVPLLNVWLGYRLLACPGGYAMRKKLDGAGKLVAVLYWLSVTAAAGLLAVTAAGSFGAMKDSGMLKEITSQLDELRKSALPEE